MRRTVRYEVEVADMHNGHLGPWHVVEFVDDFNTFAKRREARAAIAREQARRPRAWSFWRIVKTTRTITRTRTPRRRG